MSLFRDWAPNPSKGKPAKAAKKAGGRSWTVTAAPEPGERATYGVTIDGAQYPLDGQPPVAPAHNWIHIPRH